jgi:hypothetical protein
MLRRTGQVDAAGRDVMMPVDRSWVEENARELGRLRALVARLDDDELRKPVSEGWTVAGTLAHIAFWDARALAMGEKVQRGAPFSPSDAEPEDVDWINDATRPLIQAIEPRDAAGLAVRMAEDTDRLVASLPTERMWPHDPDSPLNPLRAAHRAEHVDQIEAALAAGPTPP